MELFWLVFSHAKTMLNDGLCMIIVHGEFLGTFTFRIIRREK